jgi:hypothetical protein
MAAVIFLDRTNDAGPFPLTVRHDDDFPFHLCAPHHRVRPFAGHYAGDRLPEPAGRGLSSESGRR